MNNYYVNEGDFWGNFNEVKSKLKYFEREKMIDSYYKLQTDFKTQYYLVVTNNEINRLTSLNKNQKSNNRKLNVKNISREFNNCSYNIKNLHNDYYYIDFKNDEENFISNLDLELNGKVEFQITINNYNSNYLRFFKDDNINDSIYKNTKFKFYQGIVIGSEKYRIFSKKGRLYSEDRIGKSNVVNYNIVKCFNNFLNKFSKTKK